MAKLKKLIKTLEAAGWAEVAGTDAAIQLRHPARPQRLTLSRGKAQVPKPVAQRLLAQAGLEAAGMEAAGMEAAGMEAAGMKAGVDTNGGKQ